MFGEVQRLLMEIGKTCAHGTERRSKREMQTLDGAGGITNCGSTVYYGTCAFGMFWAMRPKTHVPM